MKPGDVVHAGDVIRRRAPHVLDVYEETRDTVLESGIVERELKQLCAHYLAGDAEVLAGMTAAGTYDERQRAALEWGGRGDAQTVRAARARRPLCR
jgi:hypothetical protein